MELNLEFINIKERARKPKATIQRSGKLGFNSEAIDVMSLKPDERFKVAINKTAGEENNLYLMKCFEDQGDDCEHAIRVSKAGEYFYLNLTSFFDEEKLDYEKNLYIYNIYKQDYKGKEIFILKRRQEKSRDNIKNQRKEEIDN